jgi:RNA polymerase sigma-70 factor (ECF subfamily)
MTTDPMGAFAAECIREQEPQDARRLAEMDLVRRVQSGDQAAFCDLMERYQSKVHSIIYGILHNREDAEDIAQQVFNKVYFAIQGFDGRCLLLTWICRIAINECYSHLRKRRVKLVQEIDGPEHAGNQPPVDRRLADRDYLNKLLARIPEDDRALLIFKEVEGHSIGELAQMTGMTDSAIKIKLFRARHKLVEAAGRLARPVASAAANKIALPTL